MRILLVEDEDLLAEFLKMSLRKSGYDVDHAADGKTAFNKICEFSYDVIILDIILPKMNGIEVCKSARLINVNTPILILSSQDAEDARVRGLDAGADDYMTKPFSYQELEARLRALYRRPQEIIKDTITIGNVIINPNSFRVVKNNVVVTLRSKEFALLAFLARNTNRVVSRKEIFENVWGIHAENASNRVDACVKEIRNKLGKEIIKTVHSVGYTIGYE